MRSLALLGGVALAATLLFTAVAVSAPPSEEPPPATPASAAAMPSADLRARLKRLPGDYRGWAQLGSSYVEQARRAGDPSYYAKADGALATAARLAPEDDTVLTGRAALAAARHDFAAAVRLAERAVAANPYGAGAYGVLADARTQLGDLKSAASAIDRMMALRPGLPAFARASYAAELRGDVTEARRYLHYALRDARTPDDLAYCRFYLGELALRSGSLTTAASWYAKALRASPAFTPALAGQARALALSGRLPESLTHYQAVIDRLPLPQYLIEYGEVRLKAGLTPDWTLLRAQRHLSASAGVRDDLTWAEFEADHGDPILAVRHARAEYARTPNPIAADALAWALHRSGQSREALPYARKATSTGWRNALFHHHRTLIERTLNLPTPSADLVTRYNPHFDPALPALSRPT